MEFQASVLPEISVSLAPPSDPLPEPYSPFSSQPLSPVPTQEGDGYRPQHLSPTPTLSPRLHRQHSPLCPDTVKDTTSGQGLEPDRFQRLLASSREHNSVMNGKRAPDLRKEIAIKVHKTKQMERRALFLSKINAPPSPSATFTPKTPPESPAIFHYTHRSPGLQSPLSLYDAVESPDGAITPWVEQVDFRRESDKKPRPPSLPSLDQISARLSSHAHGPIVQIQKPRTTRAPLPAFLRSASPPRDEKLELASVPVARAQKVAFLAQPPTPRPVLPAAPLASSPKAQSFAELMPAPRLRRAPPPPLDPLSIRVTTTVVPHTMRVSPVKLTETNLALLTSRARSGVDMMAALRRRTSGPGCSVHERMTIDVAALDERKARRISAPAELQLRPREGFSHPVLALPGGF